MRPVTLRDLTVKERIQLHLFDHNRFADAYEAPLEVTQEGIARSVGIRVHHVSQYIKPLVAGEVVDETTRHIRRKARKRKVYFLTPKGRHEAASLRNSLLKAQIPFRPRSGDIEEVPLSDVYQEHRRGTTLLELLHEMDSVGYVTDTVALAKPEFVDLTQEAPKVETFYGREEELEKTLGALSQTPLIVVTGMAGVGKTTFGSRICERLRGKRSLFWRQVRPWDTALDLAQRLAAFLNSLGRVGLHSSLSSSGPTELSRVEELLQGDLVGVEALLVLDDVHNASEDAQAFLSILLRTLKLQRGTTALLLSRTVPDFYSRREVAVESSVVEIPLKGLDARSSQSLLEDAGIAEPMLDDLVKVGGGNPLFLKLIAGGGLKETGEGSWRTLETYISEEIEPSLDQVERGCLEVASQYRFPVPGEGFLLEGQARGRTLVGLRRKGLLDRVNSERFLLHDALRSYFRRGISRERRERMIPLVVDWLRTRAKELTEAGNPHEAITYMENALAADDDPTSLISSLRFLGRLRRLVGDYPKAVEAYRMALGITKEAAERARLHRDVARCFVMLGDAGAAEEEIKQGLGLTPPLPSLEAGWLYYLQAQVSFQRQDFDKSLEEVERVRSWLPSLPEDLDLKGSLANTWGLIHYEDPGRMDPTVAKEAFWEAIEAWQAIDAKGRLCLAYNNLALASIELGQVEEAMGHLDKVVEMAEATGNLPAHALALFSKARHLTLCLGEYEAAETLYQQTYLMAKKMNRRSQMIWHHWHLADLYRLQGRYQESKESMEYFLKASHGILNDETRIAELSFMARICVAADDLVAAKSFLEEAENLRRQSPSDYGSRAIEWASAVLSAQCGDTKKAESSFLRAYEFPVTDFRGELLLDFGRFLVSTEKVERATEILAEACDELARISRPLEKVAREALRSLESSAPS